MSKYWARVKVTASVKHSSLLQSDFKRFYNNGLRQLPHSLSSLVPELQIFSAPSNKLARFSIETFLEALSKARAYL